MTSVASRRHAHKSQTNLNPSCKYPLVFGAVSLPVLIAIWFVPWFVTQDGPLHLYNAYISTELSSNSFLASVYASRGELLPYLGGYNVLSWLMLVFSDRTADRLMMTMTLLGPAASIVWLRWRVRGWDKMNVIIILALLMSTSRLWLLGLYPFLIGVCLFNVTLGIWWMWRDDLKTVRVIVLAALLVVGYFFHIISTSFTVAGIVILALATPSKNWGKRLAWTFAGIIPVAVLMISFGIMMRNSAGGGAEWVGLNDAVSLTDWLRYLQAPDFISFSFKTALGDVLLVPTDCPFVQEPSTQFSILAPSLWAFAGLVLLVVSALKRRGAVERLMNNEHRGWVALVLIMCVAGLFGPTSLGQGGILRERVLLLGMAVLAPVLTVDARKRAARLGVVFTALALIIQTAFVWHYALISNQVAGGFAEAKTYVGTAKRAALVVIDTSTHYVISPLPNIVNQLGIGSGDIIWNNYGPAFYYFPVAFRDDSAKEQTARIITLNELLIGGGAEEMSIREPEKWTSLLHSAFDETDTLIEWGTAPWFDASSEKFYEPEPVFERGRLRVFRHK